MRQRFTTMFLAASLAVVVTGCASKQVAPAVMQSPSAPSSQPATGSASFGPIRSMTLDEKQHLIAANFQPEVPVPFGEVVKGEAQGDTAWDYELVIDAPVAAVASWYQESYMAREWQMVEQTAPQVGSLTLTLTKNAAQTRLIITPTTGGKARVVGILGVGAPVLQTQ